MKYYYSNICQRGLIIQDIRKIPKYKNETSITMTSHILMHQKVDEMSRKHRTTLTPTSTIPLPQEWIHLSDNTGVITGNEKIILETQQSTYEIEEYYINRWQTTASTLRMFDWTIYKTNYERASPSTQVYITKMMTGWLPVYHHLNKMESMQQKCPLCQQEETISHLFQCPHRQNWRKQFLQHLDEFLNQQNTSHLFRQNLHRHMQEIFTPTQETQHFKHFTLFAGLIPTDWPHQANPDDTTNLPITPKQHQWATKLSAWYTRQGQDLWIARNNHIYNKENNTTHMDRVLNTKIRQFYELQNCIGYHDQEMFSQPIEERLSLTEKKKMNWIEQTTKTMKVSMANYADKQTTGQKDIRQFFSHKNSNRKN